MTRRNINRIRSTESSEVRLVPLNFAAFCIDKFAGRESVPRPDAYSGGSPEWTTEDEPISHRPTLEELMGYPDIRMIVEASGALN